MPEFKRHLTDRIALDLESSGTFTTDLPTDPAQRVVDVWWAARAAARRLHRRIDIATRHAVSGQRVLITVQAQPGPAEPLLPAARRSDARRVRRVEP